MTPIYFLLSLLLLLLSTSTTTTADIVLDSKGNPVVPGSYYYAVPVSPVITKLVGGGLTMFNNGSVSCPSFIVAQSSIRGPLDYGIPLKFTPNVNIENNIHTSSKLNIAFKYLDPKPACRRRYTKVWTMTDAKLVMLDGVEGSDASWFTLEYGYDFDGVSYYSLAFENKMLFAERKENGGILLGLLGGLPPFVRFDKEGDREMSM